MPGVRCPASPSSHGLTAPGAGRSAAGGLPPDAVPAGHGHLVRSLPAWQGRGSRRPSSGRRAAARAGWPRSTSWAPRCRPRRTSSPMGCGLSSHEPVVQCAMRVQGWPPPAPERCLDAGAAVGDHHAGTTPCTPLLSSRAPDTQLALLLRAGCLQERPVRGKMRDIECPADCPAAIKSLAGASGLHVAQGAGQSGV